MELPTQSDALLDELSIRIYKEPFLSAWRDRRDLPEVARTVALIIDFDTEVSMNGLLGFLENGTGGHLADTIQAFERVGAVQTAEILRVAEGTMTRYGVDCARLEQDLQQLPRWHVTSFSEAHGHDALQMGREIEDLARGLYVHLPPEARVESALDHLAAYVERNLGEIRELAQRTLNSAPSSTGEEA